MEIIMNTETVNIDIHEMTNLDEILKIVEKDLPAQMMVVNISINDKIIDDWHGHPEEIYVLPEDKLAIKTEVVLEVGKNFLKISEEALGEIKNELQVSADLFREGKEQEANTHLINCIDKLRWYLQVIQDSLVLMGQNFDEMLVQNPSIGALFSSIPQLLEEFINVQESKDWVHLADMIEYELIEKLGQLDSFYTQLYSIKNS